MKIHLLLVLIVLILLSQISVAKTNLPTIKNNFKEQKFYKKFGEYGEAEAYQEL
jgi:hypothetical protein